MKKVNLIILLISISLISIKTNAQKLGFEEDDFALTVSTGAFGSKTGDVEQSGYNFQFSNAMFLIKHVTVGLKFGFNGISSVNDNFSFGVFSRYYFTPEKRFSIYGNLGFDYMTQKKDNEIGNSSVIKITPGVSYFLNENIIIEAGIGGFGFNSTIVKDEEASIHTNKLFFGTDLSSLQFGIVFRKN